MSGGSKLFLIRVMTGLILLGMSMTLWVNRMPVDLSVVGLIRYDQAVCEDISKLSCSLQPININGSKVYSVEVDK